MAMILANRSVALSLSASFAMLLLAEPAGAVSAYLRDFNDLYATSGTRLDSCGLCHNSFDSSSGINPFGADFRGVSTHAQDPLGALMSIEGSDPDGDGSVSIAEIEALFMPGWSCDNLDQGIRAPADLAQFVDPANPGCPTVPETACFDGIDDDGDGLTDCEDPDCDAAMGMSCDTGLAGACAGGTLTCSERAEACFADLQPAAEGPAGDATCSDGIDGDCDGLVDQADPDCQAGGETACWDGLDDDGDGLADCADPDCQGSIFGPCDTGELGICAAGMLACSQGASVCVPDLAPEPEGPFGSRSCTDAADNDCDGFTDALDESCQEVTQVADVYGLSLRTPKSVRLRANRSASKKLAVTVAADTSPQATTVTLFHEPLQAVSVTLDPAFQTGLVSPGGGPTAFRFDAEISCNESGTWLIEWVAEVEAPENRDALGDVLTATTSVVCR